MTLHRLLSFLMLCCCCALNAAAADEIYVNDGIPVIQNYVPSDYAAHPENGVIQKHPNGLIYVANRNGILEFDGSNWRLINVPSADVVDMQIVDSDIYVASEQDFGQLVIDSVGEYRFKSALQNFSNFPNDVEIQQIIIEDSNWLIVTPKALFFLNQAESTFKQLDINLGEGSICAVNDQWLFYDQKMGVVSIDFNTQTIQTFKHPLSVPSPVKCFLQHNDVLLAFTVNDGIYNVQENAVWQPGLNGYFKTHGIHTAIKMAASDDLLVSTKTGGILELNQYGTVIRIFEQALGLANDQALGMLQDELGNLWFATTNGISKVELGLKIGLFNDLNGVTANALDYTEGYLGTSRGLLRLSASTNNTYFNRTAFTPVSGFIGVVENMVATDSGLYFQSFNGIYNMQNARFKVEHPGKVQYFQAVNDVFVYQINNEVFYNHQLFGQADQKVVHSAYFNNHLYLITEKRRLLRMGVQSLEDLTDKLSEDKIQFTKVIQGKLLVFTNQGVYDVLEDGSFKRLTKQGVKIDKPNVVLFQMGHLWYAENGRLKATKVTADAPDVSAIQQVLARMPRLDVNSIKFVNNQLVICSYDGVRVIDVEDLVLQEEIHQPLIVNVQSESDLKSGKFQTQEDEIQRLSTTNNSIRFNVAAINYQTDYQPEFRYKLKGYQDLWSEWSVNNIKEYTNLPKGLYVFEVQTKDVYGNISESSAYSFFVPKPWYKEWYAILGYVLIAALLVGWFIRARTQRLLKQRQTLRKLVDERTVELKEQTQVAQEARKRAEESEKFKEQFLANMSHEIRTPMNAVRGMTNLLLGGSPKKSQMKYLNGIKQSSDNLLVIINDILDFSKIEAGKIEFESVNFSLKEVLQGLENTMMFKAQEKELDFKVNIDADVQDRLKGDPTRLNQILINLTGNAIKFTESGTVSVNVEQLSVNQDTANLKFYVVDTGIGIPADKVDTVFESFSQASSDTTRKFGGTGLGLTISKEFVELQGGEIGLTSTLGEGTTFYFNIPFKIGDAESSTEVESTEVDYANALKGAKVLLVEDNDFNQMVAVDTLESLIDEVEVVVAENGEIAVSEVLKSNFDIVLMDVNMPVMDGLAATRAIRADQKISATKIMAMTASATKAEVDKCYEAGMNSYISKPFDPDDLLEKMYELIQR